MPSALFCFVLSLSATAVPQPLERQDAAAPLSHAVVQMLQAIVQRVPMREEQTVSRIGDSQTVQSAFMRCFAEAQTDAGNASETVEFFRSSDGGYRSYLRKSLSAKDGQMVHWALAGPALDEMRVTRARYAVVMFGTNDVQNAPTGGVDHFGHELAQLADQLLKRGTIPLLTTPPPRPFRAADVAHFGPLGATPWIPQYAAIVRQIAADRALPVIELEAALQDLPGQGIRGDGVHLSVAGQGPCDFSESGMLGGHNVRNWLTIQMLHRVRTSLTGAP